MNDFISPKYQMKLIKELTQTIEREHPTNQDARYYIEKWHDVNHDWNHHSENFYIREKEDGKLDLVSTLNYIDSEILIKIAIDLGLDTPDFIPTVSSFKNLLKADYKTANTVFEKAIKQIENHPDMAISLVNSALEGIIRQIFKDERIKTKPKPSKTLYDLTSELLKEFQLFPESDMPVEIKTIGSSLLSINQSIEKLRSEKTDVHGKTSDERTIEDSIFAYFIVNAVTTVGKFLISYYNKRFPPIKLENEGDSNLPF
jgi:hypothetical protein